MWCLMNGIEIDCLLYRRAIIVCRPGIAENRIGVFEMMEDIPSYDAVQRINTVIKFSCNISNHNLFASSYSYCMFL